jgi:hypothetical protein
MLNIVYSLVTTTPSCVTASVTESKQDQFKGLESKQNLEGQPKWEILVSDQTTKITEVNLVSISAIREYVALLWGQYQEANKKRRSEILDELCRNLEIHRKAATRLMNYAAPPMLARGKGSGGRSVYSPEARAAIRILWREMGYLGAVRLKAALPKWLPFFESPIYSDQIRSEVLAMSAATIERILKKDKAALCRRLNTGTKRRKSRFQTEIPVRNFTETPTSPSHCEVAVSPIVEHRCQVFLYGP